ncbi:hypothetical protein CERSUDRAFT_72435 [Gelatoporia subvermispora B]|uniref:Zn(2)-C6 fungal-type domain-containing protein n=1 Tax=Ceriporiopsis subvermispora (strain B) TaxID=914234 RepID=M2R3X8_CERS8|nr:hypothetical protein CERSUDRAFT_72435 [Gelatoporia subvermispora B]
MSTHITAGCGHVLRLYFSRIWSRGEHATLIARFSFDAGRNLPQHAMAIAIASTASFVIILIAMSPGQRAIQLDISHGTESSCLRYATRSLLEDGALAADYTHRGIRREESTELATDMASGYAGELRPIVLQGTNIALRPPFAGSVLPVVSGGTATGDPYVAQSEQRIIYNTSSRHTRTENNTTDYALGTHLDQSVESSAIQAQDAVGGEVQFYPLLPAHLAVPETEWSYQCHCNRTMSQSPSTVAEPLQHSSSAGPSTKASVKGSAGSKGRRVSTNRCLPGNACDACHAAKIGCSGFQPERPCGPCLARHTVCKKTRPMGQAGRPRGTGKKAPVEPGVVPGGSKAHHSS